MRYLTALLIVCAYSFTGTAVQADISEAYQGSIYCVSAVRGDDVNNGRSWTAAKETIQGALAQVAADHYGPAQIWVSAETALSNGTTTDTYTATPSDPIVLPDGVSLFGGFDGYEGGRLDRNWHEHVTIIDGGVSVASGVLDGFTIQNPGAYGVTCDSESYGLISHNIIKSVSVGVYCANCASPTIINNLIVSFSLYGVQAYSGLPYIIDENTIVGSGSVGSAGIALAPASNYESCAPSSIGITRNIITGCATGVSTSGFADFQAAGNDLCVNVPGIPNQLLDDPQFVSPSTGDYRLGPGSPCIDVTSRSAYAEEWDLDCNPRAADITGVGNDGDNYIDMGAYEYPSPPMVDRSLPTDGVNASTTASRTNIRWADSDPNVFYGDDFTLPAGQWTIDKVRVWAIPTVPGYSSYYLGDHFSTIRLYFKQNDFLLWEVGGMVVGSNVTSNPHIKITPITYSNGQAYLRADGGLDQVWQIDFSNVRWNVTGGVSNTIVFGVSGIPRIDRLWFNAASSGIATGDGHLRRMDLNTYTIDATPVDPSGWFGGKGSDINVQVYAHPL